MNYEWLQIVLSVLGGEEACFRGFMCKMVIKQTNSKKNNKLTNFYLTFGSFARRK